MKKIFDSFKDKKFKYGGYATLMVAIVVALMLGVNLLVDQVQFKADLTREKLYSLSDQTENMLEKLEQDVEIFPLYEIGGGNSIVREILSKYERFSKRLKIEYIDPYRTPGFAQRYEKDGEIPGKDYIVVASGDRSTSISPFSLVNYASTGNPDDPYETQAQSLKVEQMITGAILNVTLDRNPVIYELQGHDEGVFPYEHQQQLEKENYDVKDLNLMTVEKVPEDADILLVLAPKIDLTDREVEILREFLFERRGSALFIYNIFESGQRELPNFDSLLKSYGIAVDPVLIYERDPNLHFPQIPIALFPELSTHDITYTMRTNDMYLFMPYAQPIIELETKKRTIEIEGLLTTSESAWGKVDLESDSEEQTLKDKNGPFNLAVAILDKGERQEEDSRAVVIGNAFFLYPDRVGLPFSGPGNTNLLPNSMNWLLGKEELISIRPKSLLTLPLRMTQFQFYLFAGLTVVLIPLLILGSGLFIWLKRRHL